MSGPEATSKPKTRYGDIPPELTFEEIIKNRAAPPCSLNDFMDYLLYVERGPEPLQFFLWYWDYLERWRSLPPEEKALSPPWDAGQAGEPHSRFIRYSHKRERSLKMSKVIAIMEMDSRQPTPEATTQSASPSPFSPATPTTSTIISPPNPAVSPPHPTSTPQTGIQTDHQPFRTELHHISSHYLSPTSPHRLRLPTSERESCLRALKSTTHPSSLLPAFLTADAALRLHAHPSFVRFALSNASPARVRFLRYLGGLLLFLGVLLDVLLILSSRASVYLRVVCLGFWWPGLAVLVAAGRGVCVWLGWRGRRQVRPWESRVAGRGERGEGDVEASKDVEIRKGVVVGVGGKGEGGSDGKGQGVGWREHKRTETGSSVVSVVSAAASGTSRADLPRKAGLRVLGSVDDESTEAWMERYRQKGTMRKVFDETVAVRNKALMMWQDRTVLVALLWGAAGATALTVVSLFVPSGRLF